MRHTIPKMEKLFHKVNKSLFDGEMEMPVFGLLNDWWCHLADIDQLDGICTWDNGIFCVGVHKDLNSKDFFNAFVHELIHVHLIKNNNYSGHGYPFQNMCRKAIDIFY